MTRNLSSGVATEVQKTAVSPVLLFAGEFVSSTVYLWNGYGDLPWNGHTWQGVGTIGSVSEIEEADEIRAKGITVTLTGIPSSYVALALADVQHGKLGQIYLGFLDSTGALIADPYLLFEGRLDVPVLNEGGDTASLSITYEDELTDLERPRESRYTDAEQQALYPGDLGFSWVTTIQDRQVLWGVGQ